MAQQGHWLTISQYSNYRDISISSVRRYIKSKKVISKMRDGKYLIFVSHENYENKKNKNIDDKEMIISKLEETRKKMKILEEENLDLKMLVSIYEKNINRDDLIL